MQCDIVHIKQLDRAIKTRLKNMLQVYISARQVLLTIKTNRYLVQNDMHIFYERKGEKLNLSKHQKIEMYQKNIWKIRKTKFLRPIRL